jgi:hypothetical protein
MAIVLDNISGGDPSGTGFSHTVTSNANGILVVLFDTQDSNHSNYPITGVTFNGVSLTKVRADEGTGDIRTEIWYLKTPAVGSYSIIATYTGPVNFQRAAAISLTGVDQTSPIDADNGQQGDGWAPALPITTIADNAWLISVMGSEASLSGSDSGITYFGSQTGQSFQNILAARSGALTPAGAKSLSFDMGSALPYAQSIISLKPLSASSTTKTILGKASLLKATTKTITGKARITISTTKTITGLSRITIITGKVISGLAKISLTTTKTITGIGRVSMGINQTITGLARITASTPQTITGKGDILNTATQTITGKGRIALNTSQTITGKARILIATTKTITGLSKITGITSQTITGKASISGLVPSTLANYSPLYNDANLKHYYPLDGNSNDAKGSVNGTDVNVTYNAAYGKFGQGASFAGNGVINFSTTDGDFPVTASTWWCWIKTSDVTTGYHSIFNKQDICTIATHGGELISYVWSPGNEIHTGQNINNGAWHFVVLTYQYNTVGGGKIYLDGNATPVATFNTGTGNFYKTTAGANSGPSQYFTGYLDELAFFDRVLTATEINNYYTGTFTTTKTITGKGSVSKATTKTITGKAKINLTTSQTITGVSRIKVTSTQTITGKASITATLLVPLASYSQLYNDSHLKHYYPLDGNSNDAKGSCNGADTNITYNASYGQWGQGASLNGTSSYIRFSTTQSDFPVTASTWWVWVKTSKIDSGYNVIFAENDICTIAMHGAELISYVWSTSTEIHTIHNINDGLWHFIVLTYQYNTVNGGNIYLDGNATPIVTFNTGTGTFYSITAGANSGPTQYLTCYLDELAYFDRVLSGTEINNYYTGTYITTQTITGKSKIILVITKTITGKSRIALITTQTITGLARIKITTQKTIQGLSRIALITTQTITGKSKIKVTSTKTITGLSRITFSVFRTITGKARIKKQPDWKSKITNSWYNKQSNAWYEKPSNTWYSKRNGLWYDKQTNTWFTS